MTPRAEILRPVDRVNSQTKQMRAAYRYELRNSVTNTQFADLGRQTFTNARLRDADSCQILQQTSQPVTQSSSYSLTISNRCPSSSLAYH